MKRLLFTISGFLFILCIASGQEGMTKVNGQYYPYTIDECGDTLILASLDGVSVSTLRSFPNDEEYRRYRRYRQYALKVYPYAVEAIKTFREVEYATETLRNSKRRKYVRKLQKNMKDEFTDPLKNLTKTQGMILIKMVEKELDTPMYTLIRNLKSGVAASYWNTLGKLYGHDLKEGYIPGKDPVLDAVLNDLNISYDVNKKQ